MDKPAKQARINNLRGKVPYVSQSALAALVTEAREGRLPDVAGRGHIREAAEAAASEATHYGPLLQTVQVIGCDGTQIDVEIQHPFAMLCAAARRAKFSRLLEATHAREPSSPHRPWGMCLYSDEVTPGNRLKPDPRQMVQSVYWSILNFGAAALSKEDFWLIATTLRSAVVRLIDAGMSQLIMTILLVFFSVNSHDMELGGALVQLASGTFIRIFVKLKLMLADESALHATWLNKGSSGTKLCICCKNIMDPDHVRIHHIPPNDYFQAYNMVHKYAGLDLFTSAEIHGIIDTFAATFGGLGPGARDAQEKTLGFTYSPYALLINRHLRRVVDPVKQNAFDPSHCVLSGCFPVEMNLLFNELRAQGIDYEDFHEYVQFWTWPNRIESRSVTGKDAMNDKRARSSKSAKSFKCSQSEALSLYQVIRHWLTTTIDTAALPELAAPLYSFLCLCVVIDMCFMSSRGLADAELVRTAVEEYLAAYAAAYGLAAMIPKHHMCLHLLYIIMLFWGGCRIA